MMGKPFIWEVEEFKRILNLYEKESHQMININKSEESFLNMEKVK